MAVEVEPEGTWHWNRAKYQSKTGGVKLAAQAQSHEHTQKPSEHATGDHRCTPVTSADPTGCVDISTGTSTGGVDIYIGGCGYIHTPVDISTPVDVVVEIRKVCPEASKRRTPPRVYCWLTQLLRPRSADRYAAFGCCTPVCFLLLQLSI